MIVSVIVEASAVSGKCRRHSMPNVKSVSAVGRTARRNKHAEREMAYKKHPVPQKMLLYCRMPWKRSQTNRAWDVACGPPTNNWQPEQQINAPKISSTCGCAVGKNPRTLFVASVRSSLQRYKSKEWSTVNPRHQVPSHSSPNHHTTFNNELPTDVAVMKT